MYKTLSSFHSSKLFIKSIQKQSKNSEFEKVQSACSIRHDPQEAEDYKLLKTRPQIEDLANLEKVLLIDPLEPLSESQKKLLIICRDH